MDVQPVLGPAYPCQGPKAFPDRVQKNQTERSQAQQPQPDTNRAARPQFPIQGMKRPLFDRQPVVALAMHHSPRQHGQIEKGDQVYLELMPALRLHYVITELSAHISPYCGRAVLTWVSTSKRR